MNYILGTIKKLWLASLTSDACDYFVTSGNTIKVNQIIDFTQFKFAEGDYSQKRVSDARGSYYQKQFELSVADVENSDVYDLQGKNLVLIFQDANNRYFITGFEQTYSIGKIEGKNEDGENIIDFTLIQNSYSRIQPIDLSAQEKIFLNTDYFFSTDSLFNPLDPGFGLEAGSELTFMFWIKFDENQAHYPYTIVERPTQYRIRKTGAPGIAWETSDDNVSYNTGVTSQFNMTAGVWYFVACYCSTPQLSIYIQDEFMSGYNIWSFPFTSFEDVPDSVFKIAKTRDSIKGFGLWENIDISAIQNYANNQTPATYSQLNSIDPNLLNNLICFYDDFDSTTTVQDQHSNNLDLTFYDLDAQ